MLCNLEMTDNPPEELEQPELPIMKNNDQRREWLRNYKDWGLWYEDEHIGVKYYRYEFENGAVLIVDEYKQQNGICRRICFVILSPGWGTGAAKRELRIRKMDKT